MNFQRTASRVKRDRLARSVQQIAQHKGRGQRGVSTEVDFLGRRKPSNTVLSVFGDEVRRFGLVVFGGNRLQKLVGQPAFELTNGGRVSTENFAVKRVDLVQGNFQRCLALPVGSGQEAV